MIELAQHRLRSPARAVIDGGDDVEQYQRAAVDRDAADLQRLAVPNGLHQQADRADAGQHRADQMGPGVEAFTVVHDCLPHASTGA
ncbi:hypothetical protein D3C81_1500890 [compost metagenome]